MPTCCVPCLVPTLDQASDGESDAVEAFENVAHSQAQNYRSAVRAGGWRRGEQQAVDQPAHLFRGQRHVYFDRA